MTHLTYIKREVRERWQNRERIDAWHAYAAIGTLLLLALIAGH